MIPIVILIPMSPTTLWSKVLNLMERIRCNSRSKCCRDSECGCGLGGLRKMSSGMIGR